MKFPKGDHRKHAIFGTSEGCVAVHPSDVAVALVAPMDFLLPPNDQPELEHDLREEELVVALNLPALAWAVNGTYLKVRERESYAFALASAAVARGGECLEGDEGDSAPRVGRFRAPPRPPSPKRASWSRTPTGCRSQAA